MEEENKNIRPDAQTPNQPGEKGFSVFLLIVGLFFTWQSVLLYREAPSASSYGAVPLFCSTAIDLLALVILIADCKKRSVNTGAGFRTVVKNTVEHIINRDIIVMVGLMVAYCAALFLGAGFMLATPVFLWVSMSYLSRGNYLKNILWTALCMLFIYLVFQMLFSVVLP